MRTPMLLVLFVACDPSYAPIDYPAVEEGCAHTAGQLIERKCCEGVLDYPETCSSDPCLCPPEASWDILYCDCGTEACFDGALCRRLE